MNDKMIYWSRCSVGNGRWFWVTFRQEELFESNEPFAFGFAETMKEAEAQALATAKERYADRECHQLQAYFAERAKRCQVAKIKALKQSDTTTTTQVEFVYRDWMSDNDSEWYSTPYRILKKTKRRVYVDKDRGCGPYGDWRDYAYQDSFVLDRDELERDGSAWSHTTRDRFYTKPHQDRRNLYSPECGRIMGLASPWATDDVKKAYRRLVKDVHPDCGGDSEAFKSLHNAYEEAMQMATDWKAQGI